MTKMQINSTNSVFAPKYNIRKNQTSPIKNSNIQFCGFFSNLSARKAEIEAQKQKDATAYVDFITKKQKVTLDEYYDIKENNPTILYKALKKYQADKKYFHTKTTPLTIGKTSLALKKSFDEKYGKNNYRIISLGTSPAFITEPMKELGAEVIFLPISHIHKLHNCEHNVENEIKTLKENEPINAALDYLDYKGVCDDKVNILLDYTCNKATLTHMRNLIKDRFGLDENNLVECDLMPYLRSIDNEFPSDELNEEMILDIEADLFTHCGEFFCNVPHFSIYENINKDNPTSGYISCENRAREDVYHDFENYSRNTGRCFALLVFNDLDKKGLLK